MLDILKPTNRSRVIIKTDTGRTCTQCGEFKTFDQFTKDKRISTGVSSWCKACKYKKDIAWTRGPGKSKKAASIKKYQQSPKGIAAKARCRAKTKRT